MTPKLERWSAKEKNPGVLRLGTRVARLKKVRLPAM